MAAGGPPAPTFWRQRSGWQTPARYPAATLPPVRCGGFADHSGGAGAATDRQRPEGEGRPQVALARQGAPSTPSRSFCSSSSPEQTPGPQSPA
jgi:hypothetical protein